MTTVANPTSGLESLSPEHLSEIISESAINPDVAQARGYRTIWGSKEDRAELARMGFSRSVVDREETYPALLVPLFRATGEVISYQLKPSFPRVLNGDGKAKPVKYETPKGSSAHVDVPPFTQEVLSNTKKPLWITEGMKKVDSLISHGRATIGLMGVYNWRRKLGTLGDWEDIPIKDRSIVICFDSDAKNNRNVQMAMRRLGTWLESKGASEVYYLVVPEKHEEIPVKGVDDWFAAGGTVNGLQEAASKTPPGEGPKDASFTDAVLTETVCEERLEGSFCWARGIGWLAWDGHVWNEVAETSPTEAVRVWAIEQFQAVLNQQKTDPSRDMGGLITGWRSVLSKGRITALVNLARGVLEKHPEDFDADPDLLCVRNGYVNLRTGQLHSPDPDRLMTKSCEANYVPGATSELWEKALEALPEESREWYQDRIGQAATGYMVPDDIMVIGHGDGSNGKSTLDAALGTVLGTYAVQISDRVLMASPDAHPTELMDLRGTRYAILEETPEARRLDVHRLKKVVGTEVITARRIRQDGVSFQATHSLFVNTNFKPIVTETDHGTWRRLALLSYPFTFRRPSEPLRSPMDRRGDPTLRQTFKRAPEPLRSAVLAWVVEGAQRWFERGRVMLPVPERVEKDTLGWRSETDLIMGFAIEALRFCDEGRTPSSEMLERFNKWTENQGHKPWTDKTFSARFAAHDLVKKNRVEKRRVRNNGANSPFVMTWLGVTLSEEDDGLAFDPTSPQDDPNPASPSVDESWGDQGEQGIPVNGQNGASRRVSDPPCSPCSTPGQSTFDPPAQMTVTSGDAEQGSERVPDPVHPEHVRAETAESDREPVQTGSKSDTPDEEETEEMMFENGTDQGQFLDEILAEQKGSAIEDPRVSSVEQIEERTDEILDEVKKWEPLSAPLVDPRAMLVERSESLADQIETKRNEILEANEGSFLGSGDLGDEPIGFDLETKGKEWKTWPRVKGFPPFVSLVGWGNRVDTSPEALCGALSAGGRWVGHHVWGFDVPALVRHAGLSLDTLRRAGTEVIDTELQAMIADPPTSLETKHGPNFKRYKLDAVASRVLGKPKDERGELLAKKYGGWEYIPPEDPDYRAYCLEDVRLEKELHHALPWTPYMAREMRVQSIMTQMSMNGFLVDEDLLDQRIEEGDTRKRNAIEELSRRWGAPMDSKSPLATKRGKEWLLGIYARFGVKNPPKTAKGGIATSAEKLGEIRNHPKCPSELREILDLMNVVTSERTIYHTIRDNMLDGRVHVDIWPRQASGRWSAGFFTTMGKRGGRLVEREVFLPDPGEAIVSFDLNQIDARVIAVHSQDENYMDLFLPGKDLHTEIAIQIFGDASFREEAKALGHGANYGMGANRMIRDGHNPKNVRTFYAQREKNFPRLIDWTNEIRAQGEKGLLDNGFGRPLRPEPALAYTQAPALVGQSGTRDMMAEGLLDLIDRAPECASMLRGIVHDEIVMSIPRDQLEEVCRTVVSAFEREWAPPHASRPIPVTAGASLPGDNWAHAYRKA